VDVLSVKDMTTGLQLATIVLTITSHQYMWIIITQQYRRRCLIVAIVDCCTSLSDDDKSSNRLQSVRTGQWQYRYC